MAAGEQPDTNGMFTPVVPMNEESIREAVALLAVGELVVFPTDTVYGVGAVAWDEAAVAKLYTVKLRPADKAIPILLADSADLQLVADELPEVALRIANRFWPGALTLVVPRHPRVPDEVTAGGSTVAVRMPDHELTRALIRAAGAPLATTSANLSGMPSPATAAEVAGQLTGRVSIILDGGPCPGGVPSTVVDLTGSEPVILRPGPVTLQEIVAAML
jgi:L-threonylcarbamoyladenylate synthase